MAGPRLPFLWPVLFRQPTRQMSVSLAEAAALRTAHRPPPRAQFSRSVRYREQASTSTRYGTANEPPPQSSKPKRRGTPAQPEKVDVAAQDVAAEKAALPQPDAKDGSKAPIGDKFSPAVEEVALLQPPLNSNAPDASAQKKEQEQPKDTSSSASVNAPASPPDPATADTASAALTSILRMEPPMSSDANAADKPPHLQAPPYVHHFDTYTLVKHLQADGGWSEAQSIEVMKAMRGLLTSNMDLARDGLVSKGDAEMESYLFRAACSELRTEIKQRRTTAHNQMGSQRTQLQHEVDILSQRIGQDSGTLKDELKGMFDDRKMAVRMERRMMENRIQELNYKITIALNSDMRSEVEGLRWVITRRVVLGLLAVIFMTLAALRFSKSAEAQSKAQRKQLEQFKSTAEDGRDGGTQTDSREMDLTSPELMKRIDAGDSPALVSLG
ncbi:hypothetical protein FH972_023662 [Carpinus fangiana]|uniref:DUF1640 domain-containing protein n=1 Tax=Carpinus fangiana TaxID=176857 RepID=A0A5N6KWG2_9ROSI|nr:hypothetical protein FH972_023662 [Carpinus fangiana]